MPTKSCLRKRQDRDPNLPPEPDNIGLFEVQRCVSELTEYGLDASRRERGLPHSVERDDDDEDPS